LVIGALDAVAGLARTGRGRGRDDDVGTAAGGLQRSGVGEVAVHRLHAPLPEERQRLGLRAGAREAADALSAPGETATDFAAEETRGTDDELHDTPPPVTAFLSHERAAKSRAHKKAAPEGAAIPPSSVHESWLCIPRQVVPEGVVETAGGASTTSDLLFKGYGDWLRHSQKGRSLSIP